VNTENHKWSVGLVFLYFGRLPEDGTSVPKHVDIGTYHELFYYLYFIVLYEVHLLVTSAVSTQPAGHGPNMDQSATDEKKYIKTVWKNMEEGYVDPP
jgi:hypothetical protein